MSIMDYQECFRWAMKFLSNGLIFNWLIGSALAFMIFAIKIGVALAHEYCVSDKTWIKRWIVLLTTSISYFAIFAAGPLILNRIEASSFYQNISLLLPYGWHVHMLVGGGLLVWGMMLLHSPSTNRNYTSIQKGAKYFLLLPCPVCIIVILSTTTIGCKLLGLSGWFAAVGLWAVFIGIVMASAIVMVLFFSHKLATDVLGISMLGIGLFLLTTSLFAPIYAETLQVLKLARHSNSHYLPARDFLLYLLTIITLFLAGFFFFIRTHLNMANKTSFCFLKHTFIRKE